MNRSNRSLGGPSPLPPRRVVFDSNIVPSPFTGKPILVRDPETGLTARYLCPECVRYVEKNGQTHAMEPSIFWGAGIFEYETLATNWGTIAYLTEEAIRHFIQRMPPRDAKRAWSTLDRKEMPEEKTEAARPLSGA